MSKIIDLTSQQFGKLLVIESIGNDARGKATWLCICDCGKTTTVRGDYLRNRHTTSCGCVIAETCSRLFLKHGCKKSPEYTAWRGIKDRCLNPKNKRFKDYGGRGISVCKGWAESFEQFLADMGQKPSAEHSIDRIDVDGNYEISNCRWATRKEQANNTRHNKARLEDVCPTK